MKHYQSIVVGGGIVGAGIFRDLALNGVETLLIEAGDFSSQTSERSSKMLHGGIRYLENFDFKLVFEALHEKNLWIKITPHLAREEAFYLPVYKNAKRPLWMIKIGLFLYDLLSQFKNSPFKMKTKDECLNDIPGLRNEDLSGAGVYFDGIMDDAKLTLEIVYDALTESHASALNYTKVINVQKNEGQTILTLKNCLDNHEFNVSADQVVYALGPFTDRFLKQYPFYHWQEVLLPSKGSHIWISKKDLPLEHPIVMTPQDEYGDRVIFVIPHQDKILVGTTEVNYQGDLFDVRIDDDETDYLLKNLNLYFPKLLLNKGHIIGSFAGIRPLVRESSSHSDKAKTSREHKIYQPNADTYVIAGGKYTTFRVMGQPITQKICHHFGKSFNPDKSLSKLRQPSQVLPFSWQIPTEGELSLILQNEMPKTFDDLVQRRLSIVSRKDWSIKTNVNFDQYFLGHFELLSRYLQIKKEDIQHFS